MPGIPIYAAARQVSAHVGTPRAVPALLAAACRPLRSRAESSVVTPGGWHQVLLEIHAARPFQARMTAQTASGTNYDQISITPLQTTR